MRWQPVSFPHDGGFHQARTSPLAGVRRQPLFLIAADLVDGDGRSASLANRLFLPLEGVTGGSIEPSMASIQLALGARFLDWRASCAGSRPSNFLHHVATTMPCSGGTVRPSALSPSTSKIVEIRLDAEGASGKAHIEGTTSTSSWRGSSSSRGRAPGCRRLRPRRGGGISRRDEGVSHHDRVHERDAFVGDHSYGLHPSFPGPTVKDPKGRGRFRRTDRPPTSILPILAFTIRMTFQVSDTTSATKPIRGCAALARPVVLSLRSRDRRARHRHRGRPVAADHLLSRPANVHVAPNGHRRAF